MEFEFRDPDLEKVYYEPTATLGHGPAVDKGFRKAVGFIAQATNEMDLRKMRGLHYHKLKGKLKHLHGINVTDQWRLIIERFENQGTTSLILIAVEDYH